MSNGAWHVRDAAVYYVIHQIGGVRMRGGLGRDEKCTPLNSDVEYDGTGAHLLNRLFGQQLLGHRTCDQNATDNNISI